MRVTCALLLAVSIWLWHPLTAATSEVALRVVGRVNATPWIAADNDFVAVAWGAKPASGASDVFVAISRDAGTTFGTPVQVNTRAGDARLGGEMPPRVALTRPTTSGDPQVVVLWTAKADGHTEIRTARSRDGGRTFAAGIPLQSPNAAGDRGWPSLTVDADGVAHVMWLDHRGLAETPSPHQHAGHEAAAAPDTPRDGVAMAQKSGLYYATVGTAASAERALATGVCYCCKTAVAVGTPGTVFAAWRHVYAGNIRDIAFTQSRDGGETFSEPVRVSEDHWQLDGCPDDGPAMVVDKANIVHMVWPTVIGGPNPEGGIFYTSTRDGRTFAPRQRVATLGSPKASHPQIAIDGAGQIFVAWDEVKDGVRTAVVRTLSMAVNGEATFGEPRRLGTSAPSTYPVLAATARGVLVAWTAGAVDASTIAVTRVEGLPGRTPR